MKLSSLCGFILPVVAIALGAAVFEGWTFLDAITASLALMALALYSQAISRLSNERSGWTRVALNLFRDGRR